MKKGEEMSQLVPQLIVRDGRRRRKQHDGTRLLALMITCVLQLRKNNGGWGQQTQQHTLLQQTRLLFFQPSVTANMQVKVQQPEKTMGDILLRVAALHRALFHIVCR